MSIVTITSPKEEDDLLHGVCPNCGDMLTSDDWNMDFVDGHVEAWHDMECLKCQHEYYLVFKFSHAEEEEVDE